MLPYLKKQILADVIKNLEMRHSSIIVGNPKSTDKALYWRKTEGGLRQAAEKTM